MQKMRDKVPKPDRSKRIEQIQKDADFMWQYLDRIENNLKVILPTLPDRKRQELAQTLNALKESTDVVKANTDPAKTARENALKGHKRIRSSQTTEDRDIAEIKYAEQMFGGLLNMLKSYQEVGRQYMQGSGSTYAGPAELEDTRKPPTELGSTQPSAELGGTQLSAELGGTQLSAELGGTQLSAELRIEQSQDPTRRPRSDSQGSALVSPIDPPEGGQRW
jgi:hypothetical protein